MKPGDDLNDAVRMFCSAKGMSLARLSTIIVNDGKTLPRFAANKCGITLANYNRIMGWLWDNWPTGPDAPSWPAETGKWGTGALGAAAEPPASGDRAAA